MAVLSLLFATLAAFAHALPQAPTTIDGDWIGTLDTGGPRLRLAFHIVRTGDVFGGTMVSLDQSATELPIARITVEGGAVRFELATPRAAFSGRLSDDRAEIRGQWEQAGASLPLVLTRGKAAAPKRPQTPAPPFPYASEDVTYENRAGGVRLAGTLTRPANIARAPAVILISGSGAQDRDETILAHKPFLVIADYLTRRGIAVLRVDDRGVGGSTGRTADATSSDFAGDVLAGVAYLKTRNDIDPARIGLIGHSEGGLIAPMVAARAKDIAFIVLLAGPGLTGEEVLYTQAAAMAFAQGASPLAIAANADIQKRIFAILKSEPDVAVATKRLEELGADITATAPEARRAAAEAQWRAQTAQVLTPWFRFFVPYDPRPALAAVTCPVLAMNGELDLQVTYPANLDAIGAALKAAGNTNVTTVPLPGLNHLFQTATTGLPTEYAEIEETFAPIALQTIGDWITARVK